MVKTVRKLLSLLLAATIMLGLIPFAGRVEVRAAGVIETHDAAYIKELLESEGDISIKLDNHADQSLAWGVHEWCVIGNGVKTLDLNGYDLHIKQDNDLDARTFTMIVIAPGATLIVNDSSGTNKGELVANGYIGNWVRGAAGSHRAAFFNDEVLYRDIISVEGGKLIFNGGKITAGRKKPQYTGFSVEEGWFEETLSMFTSGLQNFTGFNVRHDGDVDKIINGTGIKVYSGEAIINGGIVQGRGFSQIEMTNDDNTFDWSYDTNAAIKAYDGRIVINNGYIEGLSCADAIDCRSTNAEIIIRGGVFETHKNNKILIPVIREYFGTETPLLGGSLIDICPVYIDGWYGSVGVKDSYVDSEYADIVRSDNKAEIVPKEDGALKLYEQANGNDVDQIVVWDGKSDRILCADLTAYWPEEEIPYNQDKDKGLVHYFGALAQSSKEAGVTAAISISGGGTISSGGEITSIEKRLSQSAMIDYANRKLSFNLKDLLPDGLAIGDSFLVTVQYSDILYNPENSLAGKLTFKHVFTVQLQETEIEILQNPGNRTGAIDETVTLSAKAENATGAIWECLYPVSEMIGGNYDSSTGEATLDVKVEAIRKQYVCHFINNAGQKTTSAAMVMPTVTGGGIEAEGTITDVTWWKGDGFNHIIPGGTITADIKQIKNAVRWYYGTDSGDVNTLIEPDGHIGTEIGTGDLVAQNVVDKDAGYYRVEYDYEANDGTVTVKSGLYHVTVRDVPADTEISEVTIHGLEDLHVGDIAPGAADLYTDDARVKVSDVKWGSIGAGDKIMSGTLTVEIFLTRTTDQAKWALNSDGKFIAYIGNSRQATTENATGDGPITVSYTYADTNPIPTPQENIVVTGCLQNGEAVTGTSFALTEGEEVDITFDYYVQESARPLPSGVSHVVNLTDDKSPSGKLPDGLALEYDSEGDAWHIRGTLTQEAQLEPIASPINFSLQDDAGKDTGTKTVVFRFIIKPKIKGMSLPVRILDLIHEHEYGAWTDTGDGATHSHVCSACGDVVAQAHSWDDGVVTVQATGTTEGVMTYTCQVCGAIKTEPVEKHTIVMTEEITANCVLEGSKPHYECEDCGMAFEDAEGTKPITDMTLLQIPLADHNWGEWTEADADTHVRVCTVCLLKETAGHQWNEGEVVLEATTEAEGQIVYTCEDCGAKKTEAIPKKVTVSFETDGAKAEEQQSVDYNGKAVKPSDPVKEGYKFDGWYSDEACTVPFDFDAPITENVTIYAKWTKEESVTPPPAPEPGTYTVTDGGDSTWAKDSNSTVTITVKRSEADDTCFSHFSGVQIDGTALAANDYEAKSGSTVVTLKAATLEKLSEGSHTITINFDDGKAETTLTVKVASPAESSTPTNNSTTTPNNPKTPPTGDNSHVGLWILLMAVSVIGLYGAVLIGKKRRCEGKHLHR